MQKSKIIKGNKLTQEYCDFIYGDSSLLSDCNDELFKKDFILMQYYALNPFKALKNFVSNVDAYFNNFNYNCPITNKDFCAVIPYAIVSDNIAKYKELTVSETGKSIYIDMVFDVPFNREYFNKGTDVSDCIDDISTALLGPGYTMMCLPSDGMCAPKFVTVNLDNGDIVICIGLLWYNK